MIFQAASRRHRMQIRECAAAISVLEIDVSIGVILRALREAESRKDLAAEAGFRLKSAAKS